MEDGTYYCKACGKEIDMDRVHICENTNVDKVSMNDLDETEFAIFNMQGKEFIRMKGNGDIYVKGVYTENRLHVVEAFEDWLRDIGYL